uniref:ST8 alpha-N-acetyl-neuraminide alpha-2,8-sialyltransferase 6 n=1 Tax=Maylandia zebra TaxID=106582 RepID=A0A3P9DE13_9CICH
HLLSNSRFKVKTAALSVLTQETQMSKEHHTRQCTPLNRILTCLVETTEGGLRSDICSGFLYLSLYVSLYRHEPFSRKKNPITIATTSCTLVRPNPFSKKRWDTCSIVGSGGILTNSGCGKMIDSADFVIRCNLPPLENEFHNDVGRKTNLVTANPSIFMYGSLTGRRGAFADSLQQYGNSLLLFPCFSFGFTRPVCQRAVYAIEDMDIPIQPIFINPRYLERLVKFWESLGLKEYRPSTGLYMTTLALEFCETVHLYGFWPFSNHPDKLFALTNHYYNNVPYNRKVHAMPKEFSHLVELHNKGVLKLHLGDCKSDQV